MKLMFDIGANVGDVSIHFSRFTDMVVAFECNPNLAKRLTDIFSGTNVIVDNRGLSNEDGNKTFNICDASTLSSFSDNWINTSRFSNEHYWSIPITVQTITLDKAIEEYGIPDYIKIDVEGYEYEVLKGLTKLLPNTVICFEWVEEHWNIVLDIVVYLQELGYKNFYLTDGDGSLLNENIIWSTWDFIDTNDILPDRKERWGMIYFKFA